MAMTSPTILDDAAERLMAAIDEESFANPGVGTLVSRLLTRPDALSLFANVTVGLTTQAIGRLSDSIRAAITTEMAAASGTGHDPTDPAA